MKTRKAFLRLLEVLPLLNFAHKAFPSPSMESDIAYGALLFTSRRDFMCGGDIITATWDGDATKHLKVSDTLLKDSYAFGGYGIHAVLKAFDFVMVCRLEFERCTVYQQDPKMPNSRGRKQITFIRNAMTIRDSPIIHAGIVEVKN